VSEPRLEALSRLPYTEAMLLETLRLYPSVPSTMAPHHASIIPFHTAAWAVKIVLTHDIHGNTVDLKAAVAADLLPDGTEVKKVLPTPLANTYSMTTLLTCHRVIC
jgi:hypothetical protein